MRLLRALAREPLDRPPIWFMRQAGRYLPEYRELRSRHSFEEAMRTPELAARITLMPLHRFPLDAAILFADIMTPLMAMGIDIRFAPGPKLDPLTLEAVAELPDPDPEAVAHVAATIRSVRAELPEGVALIGFAGAPATLLAYLLEGEGSRTFPAFRAALRRDPALAGKALDRLGGAMRAYLELQVEAGVHAVQLFDSWAGLLDRSQLSRLALPAAETALLGLRVPSIYFAPGVGHGLDLLPASAATGIGVDWRRPLRECWEEIGTDRPIQGNLDPAVLMTDPATVRDATRLVLASAGGRPGHIFNLGHGIWKDTPVENVAAMVETVVGSGS